MSKSTPAELNRVEDPESTEINVSIILRLIFLRKLIINEAFEVSSPN